MKRAATIDALGPGAADGELGVAVFAEQGARLVWDVGDGAWYTEPRRSITLGDGWPMALDPVLVNTWGYVSHVDDGSPRVASAGTAVIDGRTAGPWGWSPRAILDAQAAYAAGLILQEKIDAVCWTFDPGVFFDLAVVYYARDEGGTIDPSVTPDDSSPGRNVGTIVQSTPTVRTYSSTGWVDAPIDPPAAPHLLPHLYARRGASGNSRTQLDYLAARWRWKGVPA